MEYLARVCRKGGGSVWSKQCHGKTKCIVRISSNTLCEFVHASIKLDECEEYANSKYLKYF